MVRVVLSVGGGVRVVGCRTWGLRFGVPGLSLSLSLSVRVEGFGESTCDLLRRLDRRDMRERLQARFGLQASVGTPVYPYIFSYHRASYFIGTLDPKVYDFICRRSAAET